MSKIIDLTGKKFNRLTVIKLAYHEKNKPLKWLCKCDCGNYTVAHGFSLKSGELISCGCYNKERAVKMGKARKKHGLTKTPIYNTWCNIKSRCENINNNCYNHYGGRGINVCDKWQTFEGFYEDMGATYKDGLSIDRIDVNGDYCKENCRWVEWDVQTNNKRNNLVFTVDGHTGTLKQLCGLFNINYNTAYGRLQKGLPIERVLKEPLQCGIKFEAP